MRNTVSSLALLALAYFSVVEAQSCSLTSTTPLNLYAEVPNPLNSNPNQVPLYVLSNSGSSSNDNYGLSTSAAKGKKPVSLFHVSGGNLIGFKTQYPKQQPFQTTLVFNNSLLHIVPEFQNPPENDLLSLSAAPGSVNGDECYLEYNGSPSNWYLCPNNAGATKAQFIAYFSSGPAAVCNATKIIAIKG